MTAGKCDKANTAEAMLESADNTSVNFPIVGIGASAGGLAAFEAFFSGMHGDVNPGMAFVLVQHLAPDHKSILAELIRRYTRMEVFDVEDGMTVKVNCVYIIPPNSDMAFINGSLQLFEPSAPRGQRLPVDFLFRSLAQDLHERAICIVLSGTGSDGTLGVRAIKGEHGMVMVENPDCAEYDGMPRSVIATGMADYELPPSEMPARLAEYAAHAFCKLPPSTDAAPNAGNALNKIFTLLRTRTGHNFSQYKPSTIHRRIERRMAVHRLENMDAYVKYLQQTVSEVDALFRDLLIGVTSFFRDTAAFKELEEQVIPNLFAEKPPGGVIRIWSAGCSSGEEAYSIAILLQEQMDTLKQNFKVQIFATDIDSRAIAAARAGVYPSNITADISPERLARFFTADLDGSAYRIHKGIRDMMIFSEHDVIKDPPFSKIDLICCRNLMIYLGHDLQEKLLSLFHYALNPGGRLFLGTSETVGGCVNLFAVLDLKAQLYQRKDEFKRAPQSIIPVRLLPPVTAPGALIQPRGNALPPNPVREHAAVPTQAAAVKAVAQSPALVITDVPFNTVNLTITGAAAPSEAPPYLVKPAKAPVQGADSTPEGQAAGGQPAPETIALSVCSANGRFDRLTTDAHIAALEQELQAKDELLQTSNEEFKSTNEEMQSVNEELQSTNEELETSKEELQSVNEELNTVNAELQNNITDLSRANNDMNNLLAGTGIGTVFVDHQLRILRFTPAATMVINLILSDVGRPLAHTVLNLTGYDTMVADVQQVLKTLIPKDVEVRNTEGQWYAMRILPYRTLDNVIEGAAITFSDITEMVRMRERLKEANDLRRMAVVVRDARDAVTVQDLDGRILAWNPGAVRMYGWSEAEALAMNVRDRIPAELREQALNRIHQLSQAEILEPYLTRRLTRDGTALEVSIISTALMNETGRMYAIATTERAK
jgi:two-component system CheB/CheR fusion protein